MADPRFLGRQADSIFGALLKKKTTKLRTKVNFRNYMYNTSFINIRQEEQVLYVSDNDQSCGLVVRISDY